MIAAVLGTGAMGAGMACSLAREGHEVHVWNRTRERAEALAGDGIHVHDTLAEAVEPSDAIFTMLFDGESVLRVADELTGAMHDTAVWLQSSTVGVDAMRQLALLADGTIRLLDAPMLGTKAPAEQGKLVPLVSGRPEFVELVRPALDAVGTKTVVVGEEVGAASALKLACNAWVASITAATAQSVALARRLGVDPQLFLEAIDGGAVDSPYAHLKGKAMLSGDWTPSFTVDGVLKDLGLIVGAGRSAGLDASVLEAVSGLFTRASQDGHGGDDMAAVVTAL